MTWAAPLDNKGWNWVIRIAFLLLGLLIGFISRGFI